MVRFLKQSKPCDQFFDGRSIITSTEAVQLQIGVDDGHRLHGSIGLKIDFRRNSFYMPMRFERHGKAHRVPRVRFHPSKTAARAAGVTIAIAARSPPKNSLDDTAFPPPGTALASIGINAYITSAFRKCICDIYSLNESIAAKAP